MFTSRVGVLDSLQLPAMMATSTLQVKADVFWINSLLSNLLGLIELSNNWVIALVTKAFRSSADPAHSIYDSSLAPYDTD